MGFRILLVAGAFCVAGPAGCGGASKAPSVATNASPGRPSVTAGRSTANLPPPKFAETINLQPVSGKILVELPATSRFIPLSSARQVPVGTLVDASAGVVRLTAATATPAQFDAGDFQAGIFEILQDPVERGLTELRIRDTRTSRTACGRGRAPSTGRRLSSRLLGLLLGDANGRFRTRGEFSAATVRGTKWGVRNRCDGTLTIVRRGVMVVTDFGLHKNVTVRAGHNYLAKAR